MAGHFSHDFNWKCYILERRFHHNQHLLNSCVCSSFPSNLGLKFCLCTTPPMWRLRNTSQSNKQHIYIQIRHISQQLDFNLNASRGWYVAFCWTTWNSWSFHLISLTRFPSYSCPNAPCPIIRLMADIGSTNAHNTPLPAALLYKQQRISVYHIQICAYSTFKRVVLQNVSKLKGDLGQISRIWG